MTATPAAAGLACAALLLAGCASAGAAPPGPVGWDVFRRVDQLPLLRPGVHPRESSSYDRRGGNDDGFRGTWSCRRRVGGRCLLAQQSGAGEVDSIWFTRNRGDVRRTGTLRIELDGRTVLDAPLQYVVDGRLGAPFAFPLVANARRSSGGVYIKVPMTFQRSMRITTQRNPHFFHVDYRTFDDGAGVPTFDRGDPAPDVLRELRHAGRSPPLGAPASLEARGTAGGPLEIARGGVIRQLTVRLARPSLLSRARVIMTFDGRRTVSAPLGALYGATAGPAPVRSLLAAQTPTGGLVAWWPLPFRRSATIQVQGVAGARVDALVQRDSPLPAALARGEAGYLHATWHQGRTVPGRDWNVLDTRGPGLLVGLVQTIRGPRSRRFLEGDDRIVADGTLLHGTGTEDFFEGGWSFLHGPFTLPLNGNPVHRVTRSADVTGAYRWLLGDAVPFQRRLRFSFEHGNRNRIVGVYSTTALWYGP
jgi:hypothetical protein